MTHTRHPGFPAARLAVEGMEDRLAPAAGALDTTFGVGGLVTISFPSLGEASPATTAEASVVQNDGKIVLVGTTGPVSAGPNFYTGGAPSPDFGIVRLNVDGSIDTTFGNNGRVRLPFDLGAGPEREDHAYAVGLQSDGRIVVAGSAISGTGSYPAVTPLNNDRWAVARLNPDGSLDTSFGTNGKVDFAYNGASGPTVSSMAIYPDDRILLSGQNDSNPNTFALVRLLPTGQHDPTFNAGVNVGSNTILGEVTIDNPVVINPSASFRPNFDRTAVAIAPNGNIFVAGSLSSRFNDFVVAKVGDFGSLLTNFGTGGFAYAGLNPIDPVTKLPTNYNGIVGDVGIQADGKILVTGGKAYNSTNPVGNFTTVRFNTTGTLDTTFGTAGVAQVPFSNGGTNTDIAESLAIQPDGKIVLGGSVQIGGGSFQDLVDQEFTFGAARLTANGKIDSSFGSSGKQTYNINNPAGVGNIPGAHSLIFTTGGKILLAGSNSTQMAVVQLQNDVTFNPLPPPPVPKPPTKVANPTTDGSLLAISGAGPLGVAYPAITKTGQYNTGQQIDVESFAAYRFFVGSFAGTVRTVTADVDGDTVPDYVVVTGPGTTTTFAVINGANPNQFLIPPTLPFFGSESFTGGAYVSAGDLDGDARAEVVVSADQGGGPRVTVFSMTTPGSGPIIKLDFLGIDDANFRGGARTAVGDVNGDGIPDLAVAAGAGGGPRVALYNGTTLFTTQDKIVNDFFAFNPALRDGVNLAIGDINGDGYGDMVFGAGSGGAPRVLIASGQQVLLNLNNALSSPLANFFVAGNSTDRGGVRVAVKSIDGDNKADLVTGSAPGQSALVRVYRGANLTNRGEPTTFQDVLSVANFFPADGLYVG